MVANGPRKFFFDNVNYRLIIMEVVDDQAYSVLIDLFLASRFVLRSWSRLNMEGVIVILIGINSHIRARRVTSFIPYQLEILYLQPFYHIIWYFQICRWKGTFHIWRPAMGIGEVLYMMRSAKCTLLCALS